MDQQQFDDLTRALATGLSRRQALKLIGGGLMSGLLALVSYSPKSTRRAFAVSQGACTKCDLDAAGNAVCGDCNSSKRVHDLAKQASRAKEFKQLRAYLLRQNFEPSNQQHAVVLYEEGILSGIGLGTAFTNSVHSNTTASLLYVALPSGDTQSLAIVHVDGQPIYARIVGTDGQIEQVFTDQAQIVNTPNFATTSLLTAASSSLSCDGCNVLCAIGTALGCEAASLAVCAGAALLGPGPIAACSLGFTLACVAPSFTICRETCLDNCDDGGGDNCGGLCTPEQTCCNGTCVYTNTDPNNCGGCGISCGGGCTHCEGGGCVSGCASNATCCGTPGSQTCIPFGNDENCNGQCVPCVADTHCCVDAAGTSSWGCCGPGFTCDPARGCV